MTTANLPLPFKTPKNPNQLKPTRSQRFLFQDPPKYDSIATEQYAGEGFDCVLSRNAGNAESVWERSLRGCAWVPSFTDERARPTSLAVPCVSQQRPTTGKFQTRHGFVMATTFRRSKRHSLFFGNKQSSEPLKAIGRNPSLGSEFRQRSL